VAAATRSGSAVWGTPAAQRKKAANWTQWVPFVGTIAPDESMQPVNGELALTDIPRAGRLC